MRMDFDYDKVNALAKELGGRIALLERLHIKAGLTPEDIEVISNSNYASDFYSVYGFHIDSNESDPFEAVTYLADAVNMKPARMNYSTGCFDYGSWENAFFMPRPCMLKNDGTVDYYLDPNDYSKKEDGTSSDASEFDYAGNAMMEWGRNNNQIWYKVVPDDDDFTSVSVYFCEYKLDDDYHAWSFINNQGQLVKHFYTPIYNGTIDGDGKLRSISSKANTELCQTKTARQEIDAAELNNPDDDKLWYTETFADITLINMLLILLGKSLNTQSVFGNGAVSTGATALSKIGTGTMDNKGLFWGSNDGTHGVKIFGMENYWGNQFRRIAGLILNKGWYKYKMTRGTEDGSIASDYNISGTNYIDANYAFIGLTYGFIKKHMFTTDGAMLPIDVTGTDKTYYTDYSSLRGDSIIAYAYRGGGSIYTSRCGAFYVALLNAWDNRNHEVGASLSCKPLS